MNKKVNTLLFILGATIVNIIFTLALIFILSFVYIRFIMRLLPENTQAWPFVIIFIGAIALSFVVYRFAMGILLKKIDMEKYFDPIFGGKRQH